MSEEEDAHPIFSKDPEEWMQYVYKKVSILTEDGMEHVGLVHTVDPVSQTFVLVMFDDNNTTKVELVLGHAISMVTVLTEDREEYKQRLDCLFRPASVASMSREELQTKQSLLRSWLLKNRLPVQTSGTDGELLTVADALVIQAPYRPEDCISTNQIILGKIQGLIKNMPADHDQW